MLFEFGILGNMLLLLWIIRLAAPGAFRNSAQICLRLTRRPWLAIAAIGVSAFAASGFLSVFFGIPQPAVHDEFSYLLAADTFGHGRLTNPPHPLWESFETIHVNGQPTYHSMYPPAQGAALALGQILTGHAIVGVWLSMAAACGAICWMMQAWLPPKWALVGAAIATIRLAAAPYPRPITTLCPGYWCHSYWGGAVAALGGAILFGAVGRLLKIARTDGLLHSDKTVKAGALRHGITLGIGCAILANSRPFEGLVAAIYAFAVLVVAWFLSGRMLARRTTIAALGVLAPTAAFMLYYNLRTTGDPSQMPYQLNMSTYSTTPVCLLGELRRAPDYRHGSMRRFYLGWVRADFVRQQSLSGFLEIGAEKLQRVWTFFCGPLLTLPMAAGLLATRSWSTRFALLGCMTAVWALAHMTWLEPHYLAPAAGLFYLFVVQGVRFLCGAKCFRSRIGPVFAAALLGTQGISTGVMVWESAQVDRSHQWMRAAGGDCRAPHSAGGPAPGAGQRP